MAGKRLLDVAALFNASRAVAQKHLTLRSQQLETWNNTSSLAKAVKNQTDRVTETAKAASFLATRLNESAPSWTADDIPSPDKRSIAARQRAEAGEQQSSVKNGLEQNLNIYEIGQEVKAEQASTTASIPSHKVNYLLPDHAQEIPEGVDINLFYSPRVANKLGGRTQSANATVTKFNTAKKIKKEHQNAIPVGNEKTGFIPAPWANDVHFVNREASDAADLTQGIASGSPKQPDVRRQ
jgi:hypothetical protein